MHAHETKGGFTGFTEALVMFCAIHKHCPARLRRDFLRHAGNILSEPRWLTQRHRLVEEWANHYGPLFHMRLAWIDV